MCLHLKVSKPDCLLYPVNPPCSEQKHWSVCSHDVFPGLLFAAHLSSQLPLCLSIAWGLAVNYTGKRRPKTGSFLVPSSPPQHTQPHRPSYQQQHHHHLFPLALDVL